MGNNFTENPIVRRRSVLVALLAATALKPTLAEATMDPYERISRDAKALAASMAALHGGEWQVCVNHDAEFALIRPGRAST
ncbi:hypothetical protein [Mesorhizobium sp. WSM2239]|uniref:Uncharacterized protein n=2 Tax=unclassified Mesorhizobium TaxID=325217 RepID=A0AAU8D4G3_9HYPH